MLPTRLLLLSALTAGAVLAAAPGASASGDHNQVVDLTFPTDPRATYIDDYHHGRSGGRAHRATDLMGEKMWKVYAAVGGEITWIPGLGDEPKPSYGYMISIEGDDGRRYSYIHLNDDTPGTSDASAGPEHAYAPGLERGSRVERGQWIGYLGDSGNAKGGAPHLHFEIRDPGVDDPYGGHRMNPYHSLRAAEERGDYATGVSSERIAGHDRVGTAVALSEAGFEQADHVVVSAAESFPDAAAAGPLAAFHGSPVLSTRRGGLDGRVVEEIQRLGATRATIVGGTAALPQRIEDELVDRAGLERGAVARLSGPDAPATAAAVAREIWAGGGPRHAVVALGRHPDPARAWPDALTSGYYGAATGAPVLMVVPDQLPPSTAEALDGVDGAVVVGGRAAVPDELAVQVDALARSSRRIAGADRFATAAAVASDLIDADVGVSPACLWVSSGHGFADALAAAPVVAGAGEVLLLVDGAANGGDAALDPWLGERNGQVRAIRVIGGAAAVSDDAKQRLLEQVS